MNQLVRVGTTYIPVTNVTNAVEWYRTNLSAELTYQDEAKAILNLANQSIFLIKAAKDQSANFKTATGFEQFSLTFEVDGLEALQALRKEFVGKGMQVGEVEDRGHAGRNFVFIDLDGNKFDVWSELSPVFKGILTKVN